MRISWWGRLLQWIGGTPKPAAGPVAPSKLSDNEDRIVHELSRQYGVVFQRPDLLKLALTHRSYLSVTGQTARESNERLEFLGDSVLGLVTSEFLYREHPTEHEGQLTKTKSLLVSKAILSRRALAMGLGKYVFMSHSEIESGGRQRLSILADAFESVVGAIYLDQGFEAARQFIIRFLLQDSKEIVADKRHTNYKSHLQEYVQSTFRTHPVYRIRSEMGPDHSKQFNVEVLVGRRVLGSGRGRNKKDAEQAAARNALEQVETGPREPQAPRSRRGPERERESGGPAVMEVLPRPEASPSDDEHTGRRRGRRGGQGRRRRGDDRAPRHEAGEAPKAEPAAPRIESPAPPVGFIPTVPMRRPSRAELPEDDFEEVGRPEGPIEESRHVDLYAWDTSPPAQDETPTASSTERESEGVGHQAGTPWNTGESDAGAAEETGRSSPPSEKSRGERFGRRPGRARR